MKFTSAREEAEVRDFRAQVRPPLVNAQFRFDLAPPPGFILANENLALKTTL